MSVGLIAPATSAVAITPSDATYFSKATRSLYVGGAGNLAVTMADGVAATFTAVPAGSIMPIQVVRVLSTGTTATSIVALY